MGPKRSCQSFCISYFTHIHFNHFLFLVNSGTLVLILVLPVISSKLLPTYMWIFHLLFLIFLIMYFCKKYRFSKIIICIDILAFWKMKTWWKCFVMSNEQVIVRIKVSFNHNRWPENTVRCLTNHRSKTQHCPHSYHHQILRHMYVICDSYQILNAKVPL